MKKKRFSIVFLIYVLATTLCLSGCHGSYTSSGQDGGDEPPKVEENIDGAVNNQGDNSPGNVDIGNADDPLQDKDGGSVEASGDEITDKVTTGEAADNSTVITPSTDDKTGAVTPPVYTDEALAEAYAAFDNALFIGDSRTEGMRMHAGIKNADFFCAKSMTVAKIVEGGKVNFNGAEHTINEALDTKQYSKVYISLGLNELGSNYIEDFTEAYNELIAAVKEKQPDAVIYLQLLIPVTQEKSDNHDYVNNGQIYWYNTHIIEIAEENGVNYVNADAPLIDENGALIADAATDGVHFSSAYCKAWAKYLGEITK